MEVHIVVGDSSDVVHGPGVLTTIRAVRRSVESRLAGLPEELIEATAHVAAELSENVLKYGDGDRDRVDVTVGRTHVEVCARSSSSSAWNVERVLSIVREIHESRDVLALYAAAVERTLELAPSGVSRQGLYRIAAVCHFEIDAWLEGDGLVIHASRSLQQNEVTE